MEKSERKAHNKLRSSDTRQQIAIDYLNTDIYTRSHSYKQNRYQRIKI